MSTWTGRARTNYFRVRDGDALREWAARVELEVADRLDQRGRRYAVFAPEGWPETVPTDDGRGWRNFELIPELAAHAAPEEIVVCIEAGADEMRYITGDAIAFRVTLAGVETRHISLTDIYDHAQEAWGAECGRAEY